MAAAGIVAKPHDSLEVVMCLRVSLQVADADAYYAEWNPRVTIRRPPRNEPWGARTFDVIDPFGNTIFVLGPVR